MSQRDAVPVPLSTSDVSFMVAAQVRTSGITSQIPGTSQSVAGAAGLSWLGPAQVGGLEDFLFSHIFGIVIPVDSYFSEGFKPPTSRQSSSHRGPGALPGSFGRCAVMMGWRVERTWEAWAYRCYKHKIWWGNRMKSMYWHDNITIYMIDWYWYYK